MSLESKVEESFTTVTAKVGAKQVDKLAKSALNNYINDMVYDILDNALDKPTGVTEEEIEEKDMNLQLSSQVSKLLPHTYVSSSISLQPWFLRIIWTFSSDLGLSLAPEASPSPQPATKSSYKNQLQVRSGKPSFVQTFANITFESRSGPLEDLRRLGKLFSEEYAADLDKVGCLDTFHWIAFICYNRLP